MNYHHRDWPLHKVGTSERGDRGRGRHGHWWVHDTGPVEKRSRVVCLVPGLIASADATFETVVPHLVDHGYRVLGLDNPGHGHGRRDRWLPGENEDQSEVLMQAAADIAAIMEALKIRHAKVVGHSGGGPIAQNLARHYPERVEQLILVGTAMRFDDDALKNVGGLAPSVRNEVAPQEFLKTITNLSGPAKADARQGDPWMMAKFAAALAQFDSSEWVGELRPPGGVHVLVLTRDPAVNADSQRALAATLGVPGIEVSAGHLLSASPNAVMALLEAIEAPVSRGSTA